MKYQEIKLIDGLEAVRVRPSMYLPGETDAERYHALLFETLSKALEQSSRPAALELRLFDGDTFSLRDDGPGLSVDLIPAGGFARPALEVMMMKLSFLRGEDWGYLTGWGPILSATAARLAVRTVRAHKAYRAAFIRGCLATFLGAEENSPLQRGNELIWSPDRTLFPSSSFDPALIRARLEELRAAHPAVAIQFTEERGREPRW